MDVHEHLSAQFYQWEMRGRGWRTWPEPVVVEPPFERLRYSLPREEDDGRRPSFLRALFRRLGGRVPAERAKAQASEPEPTPAPLLREGVVEVQTVLPAKLELPREAHEPFLANLSNAREPISFELLGTPGRVSVHFAAHPLDAPHVRRQLAAYFPDAVFQPATRGLAEQWHDAGGDEALVVEFGLAREFLLSLANGKVDPFIGLVGALAEMQPGEMGVFQVLFQAVEGAWAETLARALGSPGAGPLFVNAPELVSAAEEKASRPLFAAVVRIGVKSADYARTVQIARELTASLRVFAHPNGNELIPLTNEDYPPGDHIGDLLQRQTRRSGMVLTCDELIGFVHLPSSAVRSAVVVRQTTRSKAVPPAATQSGGICLGDNPHLGQTVPVFLSPEQRVRHVHVVGASGTGKSTLLFNMIRQDIENGEGVAVLDPHGDLVERILGIIPPERFEDVVLVDPADEQWPVGFNILSAHSELEKNLLASDLVSVFQRLSTSWGDQMGSVLNNAILAMLESDRGGTLADLRRFLLEREFREDFLQTVRDPELVYYWTKGFPQLSGNRSIGPVLTRLETFLSPKPIRYMVSQPVNRLDFSEILDTGKVFLAKLSQGLLGKENSYLLGSLLVSKFQQLAMARQAQVAARRRDFWLYVDEFHNFITPSMAEILSGARKYRIGLMLAHQELRQLQRDPEVASAVLSNPGTRICFRLGDEDARRLADGFSYFEARDLQNLGIGEAICRVDRSDWDFNLKARRPDTPDEAELASTREAVIAGSRQRYGTPRTDVEAALRNRLEPPEHPRIPEGREAEASAIPTHTARAPKPSAPPEPSPDLEALSAAPSPATPSLSWTTTEGSRSQPGAEPPSPPASSRLAPVPKPQASPEPSPNSEVVSVVPSPIPRRQKRVTKRGSRSQPAAEPPCPPASSPPAPVPKPSAAPEPPETLPEVYPPVPVPCMEPAGPDGRSQAIPQTTPTPQAIKSNPTEPACRVEAPPAKPKSAAKAPAAMGRGGPQHQAIQRRLKREAQDVGFHSTIEKKVLDGSGSIDLFVEREDHVIACEIGLTTTIAHEVGNVAKCLKAGIHDVVVICVDTGRLRKIEAGVTKRLGPEQAARVSYCDAEAFVARVRAMPRPAPADSAFPATRRGYKVKRVFPKLTAQQQKEREEETIRLLAETLRRKT